MFTLPELSYETGAFGAWTSAETFEFHYGKHHAGYVKKLNAALEGSDLAEKSVEEVIAAVRGENQKVFNLEAQHYNHSFFWACLSPESGDVPAGLAAMIDRDFGSMDAFKEAFTQVAATHFGSGWAWLVVRDGKLAVEGYHDADTPVGTGVTPLLTLDVWEHAYYIDHRNNRGAFIEGFWSHVDWGVVNARSKE